MVEVALAVGIFSMVAIAVTAVLSSSTSGAQTALETTIAREEIDTQAEALRFIQTAYAISKNDTENNKYYDLWKAITAKAYQIPKLEEGEEDTTSQQILNYAPTSCKALYEPTAPGYNHMFVLNPRALDSFTTGDGIRDVLFDNESMVTLPGSGTSQKILQSASINPRLVFAGTTSADNKNRQDAIIDDPTDPTKTTLFRAEGIYIIAVRDAKTTDIVDVADGKTSEEAAFYDFYIRSCWYGTDSDQPSTISTVIRLYDPDVLQNGGNVFVHYDYGRQGEEEWPNPDPNADKTFPDQGPARKVTLRGLTAPNGWTVTWKDQNGHTHLANGKESLTEEMPKSEATVYNLTANWVHIKHHFKFDYNYASGSVTKTCYEDEPCQAINHPDRPGYTFVGWCTAIAQINGTCSGTLYKVGDTIPVTSATPSNNTLYAIWEVHPDTVFLIDSSGSMSSMIRASKKAIINMTSQTTILGGKVALFEYAAVNNRASQFYTLCTFGTCTSSNIGTLVSGIDASKGNENTTKALIRALETLNGKWSSGQKKTIVIFTDEPISANQNPEQNDSDLDTFASMVENQNILPLDIYIVAKSNFVSGFRSMLGNRFNGYTVNLSVIGMNKTLYDNCTDAAYESQNANCKTAIDDLVNQLKMIVVGD